MAARGAVAVGGRRLSRPFVDSSLQQHPPEEAFRRAPVGAGNPSVDGIETRALVELARELPQQLGALGNDEVEEFLRGRILLERRDQAIEAKSFSGFAKAFREDARTGRPPIA